MAHPPSVPNKAESLSPESAFTLSPIITVPPSDEHGKVIIANAETVTPSRSSNPPSNISRPKQIHIGSNDPCAIEETRSEQLQNITTLMKTWLELSQNLAEDTILLNEIVLEAFKEMKRDWDKTGSGLGRSKAHDKLYELAQQSPKGKAILRTPLPTSFRYPTTSKASPASTPSAEYLHKSSGKTNQSTSESNNEESSITHTGLAISLQPSIHTSRDISKTDVSSTLKHRSIPTISSRRNSSNVWRTMKTITGIGAIENLFVPKKERQQLEDELTISRLQVASVEPQPTPQALAGFIQSIQGTERPGRTMKSRSFRRERVKTLREDPTRIRQLLASIERLLEDSEALIYVHLEEHGHAKAQELYEVVEKELGPFTGNFYFPKYHLEVMRQNDLLQGSNDFLIWNQALEMDD